MSERTAFPGISYEGMTCFVTGAASGIGLETAMTFADLGQHRGAGLDTWRRRGRRPKNRGDGTTGGRV